MWICLNEAFLSVVSKDCPADCLLVRARRRGDIERVFPGARVEETPGNDYLFRAVVKRSDVADALARQVEALDYDNFKNSVRDRKLHDAYASFWHTHARLQEIPPYSARRNKRQGELL